MVKVSREFMCIEKAVEFVNKLEDVFTSFIVPEVTGSDGTVCTTYHVVWFEEDK